jgi:hypothetical protein
MFTSTLGSRDGLEMTMGATEDTGVGELGAVDYPMVEFPPGASSFIGEMAAEPVPLSDAGTIRVLDLLILQKAADGSIDGARQRGRCIGLEATWAAPFAGAARRSGGQLIATGRTPIQAIAASVEAELAAETRS